MLQNPKDVYEKEDEVGVERHDPHSGYFVTVSVTVPCQDSGIIFTASLLQWEMGVKLR